MTKAKKYHFSQTKHSNDALTKIPKTNHKTFNLTKNFYTLNISPSPSPSPNPTLALDLTLTLTLALALGLSPNPRPNPNPRTNR